MPQALFLYTSESHVLSNTGNSVPVHRCCSTMDSISHSFEGMDNVTTAFLPPDCLVLYAIPSHSLLIICCAVLIASFLGLLHVCRFLDRSTPCILCFQVVLLKCILSPCYWPMLVNHALLFCQQNKTENMGTPQ